MHSLEFLPDTLDAVVTYISVVRRAKRRHNLGRIEIRIPHKYKSDVISAFRLQSKDNRLYFFDTEEFKTGASLLISFFQEGRESMRDIVAYMLKYTAKNASFSPKRSNEYYIFRKLGIRSFTYSTGVLPSLLAYQKVRLRLVSYDERYKDMYELQKDIDAGRISFATYYEKIEPTYITKQRYTFKKITKEGYNCPIFIKMLSNTDYLQTKEGFKLVAVVVTINDTGECFTWRCGEYERIVIDEKET